MDGKTIITVIVARVSYMAINKWILTPMKRGPNQIRKEDDDDDPPSLPSSSPLPPEQRDDPASIRSSSTLPPPPPELEYDVFLSFRGETRKGIASSLYFELKNSGIKTFMDEKGLEPGTGISPCLLEAIEKSRSAIVLLSPDYASSRWCLDELDSIVQGLETRNTTVLPVFYNVEPCDVRNQIGSFGQAFTRHEKKHRQKMKRWKAVLTEVANLSGWESKLYR